MRHNIDRLRPAVSDDAQEPIGRQCFGLDDSKRNGVLFVAPPVDVNDDVVVLGQLLRELLHLLENIRADLILCVLVYE